MLPRKLYQKTMGRLQDQSIQKKIPGQRERNEKEDGEEREQETQERHLLR